MRECINELVVNVAKKHITVCCASAAEACVIGARPLFLLVMTGRLVPEAGVPVLAAAEEVSTNES